MWIPVILSLTLAGQEPALEPEPQPEEGLEQGPGVVRSEFVFDSAPFEQCHAATLVESNDGLVAAWFGGPFEGHPQVGIWLSRRGTDGWSPPELVGRDVPDDSGKQFPCWNPVLTQAPGAPLLLFYKCGPNPSEWWGMVKRSDDDGATWSGAERLPDGVLGPVKDKPFLFEDGRVVCGSSTEHDGWRVHFELTDSTGSSWRRLPDVADPEGLAAIQPTILRHPFGRLQALCRSQKGVIAETWSADGGRAWTPLRATALPNPDSGLDAVTLADGRQLLVYNHTVRGGPRPKGREMLNVAVSDDGVHWQAGLVLENEPNALFSYPAVIQSADGRVHVVYTWQRERIKHVVLDPTAFELRDILDGAWPE